MNLVAESKTRLIMAALATVWIWGVNAFALAEPTLSGSSSEEKLLISKLRLLQSLLDGSPVVSRIGSSSAVDAKRQLDDARSALASAQVDLKVRRYREAEEAIDRGLRALTAAAQTVADATRSATLDRQQFTQMRRQTISYREAVKDIFADGGEHATGPVDLYAIDELLLSADGLANENRYADANAMLARARSQLESALVASRDKQTLVHELKFGSLEEEYAYEQQRNRAQEMLIEMITSQRPLAAAHQIIASMVERNASLRARAEAMAAAGDVKQAIATLEQATQRLNAALRIAGIPVP